MKKNITSTCLVAAIALITIVVFAPKAQAAEWPNILVGEDLTVGSTGPGVTVLQGLLSEEGYLTIPVGIPMGYFGSLTQSALARYQADNHVYPAVGYFGPLTKVAMHQELTLHGSLVILGW